MRPAPSQTSLIIRPYCDPEMGLRPQEMHRVLHRERELSKKIADVEQELGQLLEANAKEIAAMADRMDEIEQTIRVMRTVNNNVRIENERLKQKIEELELAKLKEKRSHVRKYDPIRDLDL